MILLDTSIWIEFLKKSDDATVKTVVYLLARNEVWTVPVIFAELLQGEKTDRGGFSWLL